MVSRKKNKCKARRRRRAAKAAAAAAGWLEDAEARQTAEETNLVESPRLREEKNQLDDLIKEESCLSMGLPTSFCIPIQHNQHEETDEDIEEVEAETLSSEDSKFTWLDSLLQRTKLHIGSRKDYSRLTMFGVNEYAYLNFNLDQLSHYQKEERVMFDFATTWYRESQSQSYCCHGIPYTSTSLDLSSFLDTFQKECNVAKKGIGEKIRAAYNATKKVYPFLTESFGTSMEMVMTIFLSTGTQLAILGDYENASQYAAIAYFFEQHVTCSLSEHIPSPLHWAKVHELFTEPDEHTLFGFFRKRISCHCLNQKYKEVKSIAKMGLCFNKECSLPGRKVERNAMTSCSGCRSANYCSRACQKADWPKHKFYCQQCVRLSALNLLQRKELDEVDRMVDHFVRDFKRRHDLDMSQDVRSLMRLRTACKRAKCSLSSSTQADIMIDGLFGGIDFNCTITRGDSCMIQEGTVEYSD
jgi:hypothetical protein